MSRSSLQDPSQDCLRLVLASPVSTILRYTRSVLGFHSHICHLSQALIREDILATERKRVRNHQSTLPHWRGPHDRIRRLPDSPSCLDLPGRRVLLHPRSATLARLGTACPADPFVRSSTTATSNVPAATSGRVKILFQMRCQAS